MAYPRLTVARGTWSISSPVLVYLPSCSSQTHLQRTAGHESSQPWEIFVPAKQLLQTQTSPLTLLLSLSWVSSYCVLKCRFEWFPGLQRGVSPWATGEYWAMESQRQAPLRSVEAPPVERPERSWRAFDSRLIGFCPVSPCAILTAATEDRLLFNFRLLYSSLLARSLL